MKRVVHIAIALWIAMILGCWASVAAAQGSGAAPHPWEDEILYQIFPRSYRDSNGDGHGDIRGIIAGLPTIERLGCTALLINPVFKSRFYHNYFADDWYALDPRFGTMQDFRELVVEAHRRHIKIILDMEPQYLASGHPWFQEAATNPKSPFRDRLWGQQPDGSWSTLPTYEGTKIPIATVDMDRSEVRDAIGKVFRFWADTGLDGFRIDHMMDDFDWKGKNVGLLTKLWDPLETELKRDHPGLFFVGEQADWEAIKDALDILGKTHTDAIFAFRLRKSLLTWEKTLVEKGLGENEWLIAPGKTQINFLENHDLDRVASVELDPKKQRLGAALLLTIKGIPSIYYGQELGMRGRQEIYGSDGNDIPVRLAYRWGSTLDAPGTALWYKETGPWWSTRYSRDKDGVSLAEEQDRPDSLFQFYSRLVHLRRTMPALRHGAQQILNVENPYVLAFSRKCPEQEVIVLANLSPMRQATTLPTKDSYVDVWRQASVKSGRPIVLPAYSFSILQRKP